MTRAARREAQSVMFACCDAMSLAMLLRATVPAHPVMPRTRRLPSRSRRQQICLPFCFERCRCFERQSAAPSHAAERAPQRVACGLSLPSLLWQALLRPRLRPGSGGAAALGAAETQPERPRRAR